MNIYKELAEYLKITEEKIIKKFSAIDINKQWEESKNAFEFYSNTNFYLYDLTNYEHSEGKEQYWKEISRFIKEKDCRTGIDYGCGIGGDMIKMMQNGIIDCQGIDIDGRPMNYAIWRMARGTFLNQNGECNSPRMIKIDKETNLPESFLPQVDLCICIAVLEHIENAKEALKLIVNSCKYLVLKVDPTNPGGSQPMHFEKNFEWLSKLDKEDKDILMEFGLKRINETDPTIFKCGVK